MPILPPLGTNHQLPTNPRRDRPTTNRPTNPRRDRHYQIPRRDQPTNDRPTNPSRQSHHGAIDRPIPGTNDPTIPSPKVIEERAYGPKSKRAMDMWGVYYMLVSIREGLARCWRIESSPSLLPANNQPHGQNAGRCGENLRIMTVVIKTANTEITSGYEGVYPDGCVTYVGVLNGEAFSTSIPTEWNPKGATASEREFDRLVDEAEAVPHISVQGDGSYKINFVGEGWPVVLKNWSSHSVRGAFRPDFVREIPSEAFEKKEEILQSWRDYEAKKRQWIEANPTREEWEYGMDEELYPED